MDDMKGVIRGMPNWNAVGPDSLPAEVLKLDHPEFIRYFHNVLVNVRSTGEAPQQWINATIKVLHKKIGRSDSNNTEGFHLFDHSGKVLLKMVASRFSNYRGAKRILPEAQCGFRPASSTIDMMFVVRRLQIERSMKILLYMCFIEVEQAYESVD